MAECVSRHPPEPAAFLNVASALQELGRVQDAARALERCLKLRPDYGRAHAALAGLYHAGGQLEQAQVFVVRLPCVCNPARPRRLRVGVAWTGGQHRSERCHCE
ncbi:hypothetical protein T484DRAFT_1810477 [Baffinella frigidus]|nr:hypothetical protein T484DRAFT_1810477 [Cryptophyta sp. CCMP2293]